MLPGVPKYEGFHHERHGEILRILSTYLRLKRFEEEKGKRSLQVITMYTCTLGWDSSSSSSKKFIFYSFSISALLSFPLDLADEDSLSDHWTIRIRDPLIV